MKETRKKLQKSQCRAIYHQVLETQKFEARRVQFHQPRPLFLCWSSEATPPSLFSPLPPTHRVYSVVECLPRITEAARTNDNRFNFLIH